MNDKIGDDCNSYLYPGLKVPYNYFNIYEATRLQEAKLALSALRASSLELGPATINPPWLCAIHHQLFQDIHHWAGKLRNVNIYQNNTSFCHFA